MIDLVVALNSGLRIPGTGCTLVPSKTYAWEQGALYVVEDAGAGGRWGCQGTGVPGVGTWVQKVFPCGQNVPDAWNILHRHV